MVKSILFSSEMLAKVILFPCMYKFGITCLVDRGVGIELVRKDGERWRLLCRGHVLWGTFSKGMRRQKI